jgi:hypothetical protein
LSWAKLKGAFAISLLASHGCQPPLPFDKEAISKPREHFSAQGRILASRGAEEGLNAIHCTRLIGHISFSAPCCGIPAALVRRFRFAMRFFCAASLSRRDI